MYKLENEEELDKELAELGFEPKEIEVHKRLIKLSYIKANQGPEFTHWSRMAYWTHDEAVALLLNLDPINVDLSVPEKEEAFPLPIEVTLECLKLKNLISRAFEIQELKEKNAPEVYLEWADNKGIKIPEALRQAVPTRQTSVIEGLNKTDLENLLKIKEEEIATLQKRLEELKLLAWEGSNETLDTYSKELAIAVKAHGVISKNWKHGSSIKKQITCWLEKNYPALMNEEKERIAKICNWQKNGGAPSTP